MTLWECARLVSQRRLSMSELLSVWKRASKEVTMICTAGRWWLGGRLGNNHGSKVVDIMQLKPCCLIRRHFIAGYCKGLSQNQFNLNRFAWIWTMTINMYITSSRHLLHTIVCISTCQVMSYCCQSFLRRCPKILTMLGEFSLASSTSILMSSVEPRTKQGQNSCAQGLQMKNSSPNHCGNAWDTFGGTIRQGKGNIPYLIWSRLLSLVVDGDNPNIPPNWLFLTFGVVSSESFLTLAEGSRRISQHFAHFFRLAIVQKA